VAVDERIRNRGLALHAVGERDVSVRDRPEIDDQVGLRRHHDFEVHRAAAAGEAADLRQLTHARRQVRQFLGRRLAVPADQFFRRQHGDQHQGGRARGDHALDPVGHRDRAAGGVDDVARVGTARQQRKKRGRDRSKPEPAGR